MVDGSVEMKKFSKSTDTGGGGDTVGAGLCDGWGVMVGLCEGAGLAEGFIVMVGNPDGMVLNDGAILCEGTPLGI